MTSQAETDPRTEWLAARRLALGGTDVPAVLGAHPWKSALEVWASKMHGDDRDLSGIEAVRWGNILQPVVAEEFSERTGRPIEAADPFKFVRHPEAPVGTTQDYWFGWLEGDDVHSAVLEIKTSGAHQSERWEDGPPLEVQIQFQCQLACTGLDRGAVAVLLGGQDFRYYDLARNDRFIAATLERCAEWWERHIVGDTPPPPDGSKGSASALDLLYKDKGSAIVIPIDAAHWLDELAAAAKLTAAAKARKGQASNHLKALLGDAAYGVVEGDGRAVSWREQSRKETVQKAATFRVLRALKQLPKGVTVDFGGGDE